MGGLGRAGLCNRSCILHGAKTAPARRVVAAAALLGGFLAAGIASAAGISTIQPPRGTLKDTYIRGGVDSLRNYGAEGKLVLSDESTLARSLLEFDLSGFDVGDTVHSATLDLYLSGENGPASATIGLYGVNRDWAEGIGNGGVTLNGATWMRADLADPWVTPGGDHAGAVTATQVVPGVVNTWYSWNITSLVRDWIADPSKNYGVLLKLIPETIDEGIRREFVSNDKSDAAHTPRLTVNYSPKGSSLPAADSAWAEIVPRNAVGGAVMSSRYSIRVFANLLTTTGVNYAEIPMPAGFRLASVDSVFVDGLLTAASNNSDSTSIRLGFFPKLLGPHRIDIRLRSRTPAVADTTAFPFPSLVDDIGSPAGPVATKEGSANVNVLDGNRWHVNLIPAPPTAIRILPDSATVSADSTLDFGAVVIDSLGGTAPIQPVWSVLGGVGSIDGNGVFQAGTAGNGQIRAVYTPPGRPALSDSAQVRVVPGAPATVLVSPDSAVVSADLTRQFAATVRDADGNIAPATVAWSVGGSIGTISAEGLFDAVTVGSGIVRAAAGAASDTAGVTVIPGMAYYVDVTPDSASVSADSTKLFAATVRDQDGNLTSTPLHWAVRGGIGTVANGLFTATLAGNGWVTARSGFELDSLDGPGGIVAAPQLADSASVSVFPGAAASLTITPGPITVSTDTTLLFAAQARDSDGNVTPAGTVTWSGGAGIGVIDPPSGLFDPRTTGVGTVHAASSLGPNADSPPITVVAGAAAHIDLSPDSATVRRGTSLAFSFDATDLDGNAVEAAAAWEITGGVGDIDTSGLFSATGIGSGAVIASVASVSDTSSVSVPDPGAPRLLSIRSSQSTVTEGQQGLLLTMRYRNESTETLRSFNVVMRPRSPQGDDLDSAVVALDVPVSDSLPPGEEGLATFHVGLGGSLAGGDQVILDALLLAADGFGYAYSDSGSDTTQTWLVESAARLVDSQNSVWPRRVARGSTGVTFLLGGANTGGVSVSLDPAATRMRFTDGVNVFDAPLAGPATLPADSSIAQLDFQAAPVPPALAVGTYPLTLILRGTDSNGMAFADTLTTVGTNAVSVIPPYVTVVPVAVPGGSARPGEQGLPLLAFDLQNGYAVPKTLTTLSISNVTVGPGSVAQRDAEIAQILLYWDRNGDAAVTAADTLLKSGTFASGRATLTGLGFTIPLESAARLIATVNVALAARDRDSLDAAIASSADLTFSGATSIDGAFPVNPVGRLVVDGSVAAQFAPFAIPSQSVAAGDTLVTAMDAVIPANGYAADTLGAISVAQRGTAREGFEISRVRLVRRVVAGDTTDTTIGDMVWTGARWSLTGLSTPIPAGGLRVAVLVNIAAGAANGRTIDLALPAGENAVTVASPNDGPADAAVSSGGVLTITTSDRILVFSSALPTAVLLQGADDVPLLGVTLVNRYPTGTPRSLTALRLTAESSLLEPSRLDDLFETIVLRVDVDRDGLPDPGEPVYGSASLVNGSVFFNNLNIPLQANTPVGLLATGFVSNAARDGDRARLRISSAADVTVTQGSKIDGGFPISSTGLLPVDGMTRGTIANHGAPPRTLPPGELGVLVLDLTIPPNGYEPDTLQSIRVENSGTAIDARDISQLRLYRDGGDGAYGVGAGDDTLLTTLPFDGSAWVRSALSVPLPLAGARIFIAADIGSGPADSATIALRIPLSPSSGGLAVASGNDGPIDLPVVNPFAQTISTSPLLVDVAADRSTASVGQTLSLTMNARNVGIADTGAVAIVGIVPTLVGPNGSGSVTILSGPTPDSLTLAPGDSGAFVWTLRADVPGDVTFTGFARGGRDSANGDPITSTPIVSPPLAIVNPPTEVSLFPTNLSPATVARGTTDFVPLSLTFATTGPPPAGSAEVWSLALTLDDGSGNPVSASDLLDRVAVREAGSVFHITDSLGAGPTIALTLDTPIGISPFDPVTAAIAFDIKPDTQVPSFRIRILDEASIGARDANSGNPVPLRLESGTFPVETGTMIVTAPGALQLAVQDLLGGVASVNRGQTGVAAVGFLFHSFGDSGIAGDVRITEIQALVEDSSGVAADPALFSRGTVTGDQTVHGDVVGPVLEDGVLRIPLSTPLVLPVNSQATATLSVSLSAGTALRHFRFVVDDAHLPSARDAVTGAPIGVALTKSFQGALVRILWPAVSVEAAPRSVSPASVYPGTSGVPILRSRLRHPGDDEEASVRLDGVTFRVTDEIGNPIAASLRLQSVGAFQGGVSIGSVNVSEIGSPTATIPIVPGITIAPGDSTVIELRASVRGGAPAGRVRFWIDGNGIDARDVNQGTAVALVADETPFPMVSALLTVLAAPADPTAWFDDNAPATVARGASTVPLGALSILNPAGVDAGTVELDTLILACEDRGGSALGSGAVFAATRAREGDSTLAAAGPGDPYRLVFAPPRSIAPGETLALALEADLLGAPATLAFRALVNDSSIVFALPGSGLPRPRARAATGQSFPFATGLVGIAATDFAQSASNYPNPFAAGREGTQFVFFMAEQGEVDIVVYDGLGDQVTTVARSLPAGPGMITPIPWDGRNADGEVVLSGVYLAQIQVRYASGRSDALVRKLAVLR